MLDFSESTIINFDSKELDINCVAVSLVCCIQPKSQVVDDSAQANFALSQISSVQLDIFGTISKSLTLKIHR